MHGEEPTERFSDRADDYSKYRPGYPSGVLELLDSRIRLSGKTVCDVGAGTGIWSEALSAKGCRVIAVEPNSHMRRYAESSARIHRYSVRSGTSDSTGLEDSSVELVTAAHAAHWFEPEPTLREFKRILKPNGFIAFVWNIMQQDDPVGAGYRQILHRYQTSTASDVERATRGSESEPPSVLKGLDVETSFVDWSEELDCEGLTGRARSNSRFPCSGDDYEHAHASLVRLFREHEKAGFVTWRMRTYLYVVEMKGG